MTAPPATSKTIPVIQAALSEARKSAAAQPQNACLPALEAQACGDLESAWASGAEDLVDSISRLTKGGLVQYRVIICEVRDIEYVEALHREIDRNPLANGDGFRHTEIRGGERAAVRKNVGQRDDRNDLVFRRALAIGGEGAVRIGERRIGRVVLGDELSDLVGVRAAAELTNLQPRKKQRRYTVTTQIHVGNEDIHRRRRNQLRDAGYGPPVQDLPDPPVSTF